jgi:hypothetical protein
MSEMDLSDAKQIKGFANYYVFPDGRVWSSKSKKFLASKPTKSSPYKYVHLSDEGQTKRIGVHVLVAQEFIGPKPDPHPFEGPYEVEHGDNNVLNNNVTNLSYATKPQNNRRKGPKTGRFKGVSKNDSRYKKKIWRARIEFADKSIHIGNYATEIEAAKAYDKKAHELDPEFAYLNFPQDHK